MSISTAMQEYLAEAYRLAYYNDGEPYVSTAALAEVMNVSAPAVTRMVQRLKDAGYVEHEPYKGIYLTSEGEFEALMSIRRHRLVERFLVDVMNFGWHEVHDTADNLGIAVSDHVVNRMEKMAGYPRRCPHGEPIPTAEGHMPRVKDYPLSEIEFRPERQLVISRVATHDDKKLHYLDTLGLVPGVRFSLISRAPFNGPLHLKFGDKVQVIGHELAGVLRVCSEEEFALV